MPTTNDLYSRNTLPVSQTQGTPSRRSSGSRKTSSVHWGQTGEHNDDEDDYADISMAEEAPSSGTAVVSNSSSKYPSASQSYEQSETRGSSRSGAHATSAGLSKATDDMEDAAEPSGSKIPEPVADSSSMPGEEIYRSEIRCRDPLDDDAHDAGLQEGGVQRLRSLIHRLDPKEPDSLKRFAVKANAALDYLASLGLEVEFLRFWEGTCRQAEYLVRKIMSSKAYQPRFSSEELRENVDRCRVEVDFAQDEFIKSSDALKHQEDKLADLMAKYEADTTKLKDLWSEIMDLLSRRTETQMQLAPHARSMKKVQQRHQVCQQALTIAETAFAQAVDNLRDAEEDHQSLNATIMQLENFQIRLFES